jgi:hypothetical protein
MTDLLTTPGNHFVKLRRGVTWHIPVIHLPPLGGRHPARLVRHTRWVVSGMPSDRTPF